MALKGCIRKCKKILGILILDVVRTARSYWSELLVVVEFVLYTTPGPHGFTPRDIDRRWSVGSPLEKELSPFQVLEFEPLTDYVRNLFAEYHTIREKILTKLARASEQRARLANRFRRARDLKVGMRVVYRDPRARAAGGRTPWKEPLTEPLVVTAVDGNKLVLRASNGTEIRNAHAENCVIVHDDVVDYERTPLVDLPEGSRPSIGEAFEVPYQPMDVPKELKGKLDKMTCLLYTSDAADD